MPATATIAHLLGGGIVLGLIALSVLWSRTSEGVDTATAQAVESTPQLGVRFIFECSTVVGVAIGLALGDALLKTDPDCQRDTHEYARLPSCHIIANARIFAEFVGAGPALIAVTVRNMLGTLAYTG